MNKINIIKANGDKAMFKIEKLIASLRKAGESSVVAANVATKIEGIMVEGMTAKEIYKEAFAQLRNQSRPMAARYKLKGAIMELEKLVAHLRNL